MIMDQMMPCIAQHEVLALQEVELGKREAKLREMRATRATTTALTTTASASSTDRSRRPIHTDQVATSGRWT